MTVSVYALGVKASRFFTKQAIDVTVNARKSPPVHGFLNRLVFGEEELAPPNEKDVGNWENIAQYMAAARPAQLASANVYSGRIDPAEFIKNIKAHQDHDTFVEDVGSTRDILSQQYAMLPATYMEQMPASYHPHANSVMMNERSPGVLIHELGHGVDLARGPNQSNLRRWLRWNMKPLLWKELSAWTKGRKAFQEGFAASPESHTPEGMKQYETNMRSYNRRKYPAYGTYLGGAAGTGLGGLAGGLASYYGYGVADPNAMILGAMLGGGAGILGGALGGKFWAWLRENPNAARSLAQLQKARRNPKIREIGDRLLAERATKAKKKTKTKAKKKTKYVSHDDSYETGRKAAQWQAGQPLDLGGQNYATGARNQNYMAPPKRLQQPVRTNSSIGRVPKPKQPYPYTGAGATVGSKSKTGLPLGGLDRFSSDLRNLEKGGRGALQFGTGVSLTGTARLMQLIERGTDAMNLTNDSTNMWGNIADSTWRGALAGGDDVVGSAGLLSRDNPASQRDYSAVEADSEKQMREGGMGDFGRGVTRAASNVADFASGSALGGWGRGGPVGGQAIRQTGRNFNRGLKGVGNAVMHPKATIRKIKRPQRSTLQKAIPSIVAGANTAATSIIPAVAGSGAGSGQNLPVGSGQ